MRNTGTIASTALPACSPSASGTRVADGPSSPATGLARNRSSTPKRSAVSCSAANSKAVLCHPDVPRDLDPTALETYLALGYALPPRTAIRAIRQVRPGHRLIWEPWSASPLRETPYWEPRPGTLDAGARRDPAQALLHLLDDATRQRLISEVPLGAFLSGGVDSSAVVAMMQRAMKSSGGAAMGRSQPVQTFCLGFDEPSWGEQQYAKQVATHLGADHREGRVPALGTFGAP
ncbi:MAG: hypothetical protein EBQ56_11630, partial [Proteobacteria bacterium]|nr:hypothetical protein [Pseudomonadota bacterium]